MMQRRTFLRMLGLGAAAAAVPAIAEPFVRRVWAVPSNAPVGSRVERVGATELHFGDHGPWVFDLSTNYERQRVYFSRPMQDEPDWSDSLFGIDAQAYPEWKANEYSNALHVSALAEYEERMRRTSATFAAAYEEHRRVTALHIAEHLRLFSDRGDQQA